MIAQLHGRARRLRGRWQRSSANTVYGRARDLNLVTHVLALGAQQVLCTAPLVVAVSAVVQRISGRGMGTLLSRLFGLDGEASRDVDRLFSGSAHVGIGELVIGVVLALLLGTGVAATQQRGFELLWGLPRADGLLILLRQLLWGIALAAYITLMVLAGRLGRWVGHPVALDSWTAALLQGAVTALFYWWGQRILLDGRISYRKLAPGALSVGIGILALTKISPLILSGQIVEEVNDYGLIGGVFVLSIWLMVLSAILMGGVMVGVIIVRRGATMKPVPGDVASPVSPAVEPAAGRTTAGHRHGAHPPLTLTEPSPSAAPSQQA